MKRYLSVFEMITRSSIYKVLLVIVAMVATEIVFFYNAFSAQEGVSFEFYVDKSYYSIIFQVAYILVTIMIVLPGMNIGSIQSYTLQRLSIKESRIFWVQALYNLCAYVLLWGVQLAVILGSFVYYQNSLPEGAIVSNQTLFLAFYRGMFMHSILPLEDGPGWWVIVLIAITTTFAAANFTRLQRVGKFGFELLIMIAAVCVYFPRPLGYDLSFILVAIGVVYAVMWLRWGMNRLGGE